MQRMAPICGADDFRCAACLERKVEILSPGEPDPWSRAHGPADYLRDYTAE